MRKGIIATLLIVLFLFSTCSTQVLKVPQKIQFVDSDSDGTDGYEWLDFKGKKWYRFAGSNSEWTEWLQ